MEVFAVLMVIAVVFWITYKISKVMYGCGSTEKSAINISTTDWKCPKCGMINNVKDSSWCLCGYDKSKPEIEKREIRRDDHSTDKFIKPSPQPPQYEVPLTSNKFDDFDNLTQAALKSALFEKNFEILGLTPKASIDEVRERCKELVKQWHPDLHKHDSDKHKQATIKIQEIKAAYEAITSDTGITIRAASQTLNSSSNHSFAAQDTVHHHKASSPSPKKEPKSYAKAWPRFFARTFDLWWESLLIGFIAAIGRCQVSCRLCLDC